MAIREKLGYLNLPMSAIVEERCAESELAFDDYVTDQADLDVLRAYVLRYRIGKYQLRFFSQTLVTVSPDAGLLAMTYIPLIRSPITKSYMMLSLPKCSGELLPKARIMVRELFAEFHEQALAGNLKESWVDGGYLRYDSIFADFMETEDLESLVPLFRYGYYAYRLPACFEKLLRARNPEVMAFARACVHETVSYREDREAFSSERERLFLRRLCFRRLAAIPGEESVALFHMGTKDADPVIRHFSRMLVTQAEERAKWRAQKTKNRKKLGEET